MVESITEKVSLSDHVVSYRAFCQHHGKTWRPARFPREPFPNTTHTWPLGTPARFPALEGRDQPVSTAPTLAECPKRTTPESAQAGTVDPLRRRVRLPSFAVNSADRCRSLVQWDNVTCLTDHSELREAQRAFSRRQRRRIVSVPELARYPSPSPDKVEPGTNEKTRGREYTSRENEQCPKSP